MQDYAATAWQGKPMVLTTPTKSGFWIFGGDVSSSDVELHTNPDEDDADDDYKALANVKPLPPGRFAIAARVKNDKGKKKAVVRVPKTTRTPTPKKVSMVIYTPPNSTCNNRALHI